ncbi:MAG: CHASE2 domain-containing protein, partial [Proteobacteria bacterium]
MNEPQKLPMTRGSGGLALAKNVDMNNQNQVRKGTERLFTLLSIAWLLTLIAIGSSSFHDSIQAALSDPVFFKTRENLHRTPPLSDRLKIYGLDDGTVGFLGSPEVTTKDFTLLLANIAKKKPKAILLDKLFGSAPADPDHKRFIEELIKLDVPIYSGASIHPAELSYRKPNDLHDEIYSLDKWIEEDVGTYKPFLKNSIHHVSGYVYGFDEAYQGLFKGMGHLGFDRIGSVYPVVAFGDKIIPHISLYAANQALFKDEMLLLDGNKVPLTEKGGVIVNHRPVRMFYEKMKSLKAVINRARNDIPEDWIKEGDVVVILFNFYTGSTDFLEGAPFGNLPGGLMVSTMVDAVMENRWITPFGHVSILIIMLSILGTVLARTTGPVLYWPAMIVVGFLYFCIAIYLFAYKDMMMAWVLPLFGLAGAGTIQYVRQRLSSEIKGVATQNQLLVERALRLEEEKTNLQLAERLNLGRAVQQILLP